MSDSDLIQSILSGNTNDFSVLVERYQRMIFTTCMGYVHNEDDANELTQDVFVSAYSKLRGFRQESAFPTWLTGIAVHACLNFLRQRKRRTGLFDRFIGRPGSDILNIMPFSEQDLDNPERAMISEEGKRIIQGALDGLPERQKTAFILSRYDGLPQREIASAMGLSEGAVESLLQRAKASLHKKLSPYFKKS